MVYNDLSSLAYVNLARLDSFTALGTSRVIVWDTAGGGQVKYSSIADLPVDIAWGEITGTLSNQTDLQAALDALATENIETVSSSVILTTAQDTILANAASGPITLTLPVAASSDESALTIKKIDSTANSVIIDGNASETIDGYLTATIAVQWTSLTLQCNGTSWYIL